MNEEIGLKYFSHFLIPSCVVVENTKVLSNAVKTYDNRIVLLNKIQLVQKKLKE